MHAERIVTNREFLRIDTYDAIEIIDDVIDKINNHTSAEKETGEPTINKHRIDSKYKYKFLKQIEATYNLNIYTRYINDDVTGITFGNERFKVQHFV